jgi:3-methyladenine DNA glycosylase AlkC
VAAWRFAKIIIEVVNDFNYKKSMLEKVSFSDRSGARRMADVPQSVLAELAAGRIETVNLMEWLAADMAALARNLAAEVKEPVASRLLHAAEEMAGAGVTSRLRSAGRALAETAWAKPVFAHFAGHKSDLVRQWACYAANDSSLRLAIDQRLRATLPFAADRNMSVRETAWMAFRPHLAEQFDSALSLLENLAGDADENIRRFAVEVTRPRSVWGAHLPVLKRDPARAALLLDCVKTDTSRYVKLAVGNWLNDASKTRSDWVAEVCREWEALDSLHTRFMTKRGLRTLARQDCKGGSPRLPFHVNEPSPYAPMENVS